MGRAGMVSDDGAWTGQSDAEASARRFAVRHEGGMHNVFQDISARSAAEPTFRRRDTKRAKVP